VTRENVVSPWMLFEAGALAKSMQEGRVIPLLLDIEFKDITGPLAQFQAKKVEKDGLRDIITSINCFSETKIPESRLKPLFEMLWKSFEDKVMTIPKSPAHAKQARPQHEILEELVSGIRGLDMRFRESLDDFPRLRRRRHRFHPMMVMDMMEEIAPGERRPLQILIIASLMRDDLPWIYELGLEAYREALHQRSKNAQRRFIAAINALRRGPFMEMVGDKDTFMLIHEIEDLTKMFVADDDSVSRVHKAIPKKTPPSEK
jgi:hypothetical protein